MFDIQENILGRQTSRKIQLIWRRKINKYSEMTKVIELVHGY